MQKAAAALFLLLAVPCVAEAGGDAFGVAGKVGTLGIGFEVSRSFLGSGDVRVAFNQFDYSYDDTASDVDYTLDLGLKSTSVLVGWHPRQGRLHFGGGVLVNGTRVQGVGKPALSYTIGDTTYDAGDVGTLDAHLDFKRVVPMAAMGWDGAFAGRRIGVAFDLGVVYQGAPDIVMHATGPVADDPQFMSDLAQETADMQNEIDNYDVYPVASVGISFRF
jgi:hypothetical protein